MVPVGMESGGKTFEETEMKENEERQPEGIDVHKESNQAESGLYVGSGWCQTFFRGERNMYSSC